MVRDFRPRRALISAFKACLDACQLAEICWGAHGGRIKYNNTNGAAEDGFCRNELNFGIPNEINAVRFPCGGKSWIIGDRA